MKQVMQTTRYTLWGGFAALMLLPGCLVLEHPEFIEAETSTNPDDSDNPHGTDGSCSNYWEGDNCDVCPENYDEASDCAECSEGYTGDACELRVLMIASEETSDYYGYPLQHFDFQLTQDGLPGVAYLQNSDLMFGTCTSSQCDTITNIGLETAVDTRKTEVLIRDDNRPIVFHRYYDDYAGVEIDAVGCSNESCTNPTRTKEAVFSGDSSTFATVLGDDGNPRLVVLDGGDNGLSVVTCSNEDCSTQTSASFDIDDVPIASAVGVIQDENAVLSVAFNTYDILTSSNRQVRFGQCSDAACTDFEISPMELPGERPVVVLGSDDLPFIAYNSEDGTAGDLAVCHCDSADCSEQTVTQLDTFISGLNEYIGLTIGPSGNPLVAFSDRDYNLQLLICDNVTCTENHTAELAAGAVEGGILRTDTSGMPVVGYIESVDEDGMPFASSISADSDVSQLNIKIIYLTESFLDATTP